jgi:hypothetical protein
MPPRLPLPEHPAVDWNTMTGSVVTVVCPWCEQPRECNASDTARRIRERSFGGYCYKDRLVQRPRADSRPSPEHPAVDWTKIKLIRVKNQRLAHVLVTCPQCGAERWHQKHNAVDHIYRGTFTGKCPACNGTAKKRDWVRLSPYRKIDPVKGYIRIGKKALAPEDQWLWDALVAQISGTSVLEPRFVMSKVLGRALRADELVDHMDGNKLNNDPENLRVYVRGRNMPGDTSGYGTYYHEWQLALAEIARLKVELLKI